MRIAARARLDFGFEYAYRSIVDLETRSIFAHEALVRGPQGEGAATVLAQVNDDNRYRFDQACRVKAIKGASALGMTECLSINFPPNAIYKPELPTAPRTKPRVCTGFRWSASFLK